MYIINKEIWDNKLKIELVLYILNWDKCIVDWVYVLCCFYM